MSEAEIRKYAGLMQELGLTGLEITQADQVVRLERNLSVPPAAASVIPVPAAPAEPAPAQEPETPPVPEPPPEEEAPPPPPPGPRP